MPQVPSLTPLTRPSGPGDFPFGAPPEDFDSGEFRALLYSHPARMFVRWWRAWHDPASDPARSSFAETGKYTREEVALPGVCILVTDIASSRRLREVVQDFEVGDITVQFLPDEIDLRESDQIVLWGRCGDGSDAPALPGQCLLVRGATPVALPGTASTNGATLTCSAGITGRVQAGDIVRALGAPLRVAAVNGPTTLTLEAAPPAPWTAVSWERLADYVRYTPASAIQSIRGYDPAAYRLNPETGEVRWANAAGSPAPGERYPVRYDYHPRYVVRQGLASGYGYAPGGVLPHTVVCRRAEDDTHRS